MKIKNIFDWVNQVKNKKEDFESFDEEDWGKYNNYMINKFISQDPNMVDISNLAQIIPPQDKRSSYLFYKSILPKNNRFFKYIKPQNVVDYKIFDYISTYFECGKNEAKDYYKLLSKDQLKIIFQNLGIDKKEITKLLK